MQEFLKKNAYIFVIFFLLLFPLNILHLVLGHWINIPFWDEWDDTVPLFVKYNAHTLHFSDWWASHNYHRIVFARLIYFLDYQIFSGNRLLPLFLEQITQTAIFLLFALKAKELFSPKLFLYWLILGCFAALFFAPQIGDIWFLGYVSQTDTALFFCLAVFLLNFSVPISSRDIVILFFAILATICSFNGLLIWPTLLFLLLVNRTPWKKITFYSVVAVGVIFLYYYHLNIQISQEHVFFGKRIAYIIAFIGSIFSDGRVRISLVMGMIGLLLYGMCFYKIFLKNFSKEERNKLLPWFGVGFLAIGSAILGSIGRITMGGVGEAIAARYIPYAVPFWAGLLVITTFIYQQRFNSKKILLFFLAFIVIIFYIKSANIATQKTLLLQQQIARAALALQQNAYVVDPTLPFGLLHPIPDTALQGLVFLHASHLDLFHQPPVIIIGKNINQLLYVLSNDPISGHFFPIQIANNKIDPCHYNFHKGFFVAGDLINSKNVEQIYILDKTNTIWGLAQLDMVQNRSQNMNWSGFVVSPPGATLKQKTQLQAWVKFSNSNFLVKIPEEQIFQNGLDCRA